MKQGQIQTQIFSYIIAIVIVGLILLFGYNAVKDFVGRADEVSFIQFKTTLETTFDSVRANYGRVKVFEYEIPGGFEEICFVDLDNFQAGIAFGGTQYPLIEGILETGSKKNVFLVKGVDIEPLYAGDITVDENGDQAEDTGEGEDMFCENITRGKATVRLMGKGDHVFVTS